MIIASFPRQGTRCQLLIASPQSKPRFFKTNQSFLLEQTKVFLEQIKVEKTDSGFAADFVSAKNSFPKISKLSGGDLQRSAGFG